MRHFILALSLIAGPILSPIGATADITADRITNIVDVHILPRIQTLAERSQHLSDIATMDCDPRSDQLRSAYRHAFDAWISVSHLRFGPTEVNDRAYALAFWPDSRGATPRALASLLRESDPIAHSVTEYRQVSIAARGFYALEFLLFDDALLSAGDPAYHCQLIQTISADIAVTTQDIHAEWQSEFAATMRVPTPPGRYHSSDEALQETFKSLSTGLQFTAETRLGRPLGTFDRPRPTRAEARRSGRSATHVLLSLEALRDLGARLSQDHPALSARLDASFVRAITQLAELDDPVFASVSDPQTRLNVEIVQQSINAIRTIVADELGPQLGVAAGFNALDGD